jgi:hypothetical protein
MCQKALLLLCVTAALSAGPISAQAQSQRPAERPLMLRIPPRSFLSPGTAVPVGSINPGYSGYGQTQSYLASPPYAPSGDRFGMGSLPDPIINGPFVGARNPFGPVDYVAPPGLAR